MSTQYTKAQVDAIATIIGDRLKTISADNIITDTTGVRILSDNDLSSKNVIIMNNGGAQTVTINTGLTAGSSIFVVQQGGTITFGGSATLLSPGGVLTTSSNDIVKIIPLGSDTYSITNFSAVSIDVAADQTAFDAASPGPLELVVLDQP